MASTGSGGEREREELQQEIAQIKQALQDEDDSEEEEEEEETEWVEGFGSDPEPAPAVSVQFDNNNTTATATRETFETATVQEFESQVPSLGNEQNSQNESQDVPGNLVVDLDVIESELGSGDAHTCLALNRAYQEILQENIKRIELVLTKNRERQESLKQELMSVEGETRSERKKIPLTVYAIPYFKDKDGGHPPPNEDSLIKKEPTANSHEPAKQWSSKEKQVLMKAMISDTMQRKLQPLMNRNELEYEKLKRSVPGSEAEADHQAKIDSIETEIEKIKRLSSKDLVPSLEETAKIDWMKISAIDLDGKFSPLNCQLMWQNAIHPSINQASWTMEEDELLLNTAKKYDFHNWLNVAIDMKTGRTAFECLKRYQTRFNEQFKPRKWSEEEDLYLMEVIEGCRIGDHIPWNQVSYYMEGRDRDTCMRRFFSLEPTMKRGRWSEEEDMALVRAVHINGADNWPKISVSVPGRNSIQCRDRWHKCLNFNLNFGDWSREEDRVVMEGVKKHGEGKWMEISKSLPDRSDQMVNNRYNKLKEWHSENQWLQHQPDHMLRFALFGTMSSAQLRKIKKMEAEIRAKIATKQEQEAPGYPDIDASQGELQTASTSDGQTFQIKKEKKSDITPEEKNAQVQRLKERIRAHLANVKSGVEAPFQLLRQHIYHGSTKSRLEYRGRLFASVQDSVISQLRASSSKPGAWKSLAKKSISMVHLKDEKVSETLHKRIENVGTTTTVKELVEIAAALKQEVKGGRCGRQRGGGAGHALRLRNDIVRELKGKKIKRKTAGRPRKYLANLVKDQIDEELKHGQGPHAQTQVVALLIKALRLNTAKVQAEVLDKDGRQRKGDRAQRKGRQDGGSSSDEINEDVSTFKGALRYLPSPEDSQSERSAYANTLVREKDYYEIDPLPPTLVTLQGFKDLLLTRRGLVKLSGQNNVKQVLDRRGQRFCGFCKGYGSRAMECMVVAEHSHSRIQYYDQDMQPADQQEDDYDMQPAYRQERDGDIQQTNRQESGYDMQQTNWQERDNDTQQPNQQGFGYAMQRINRQGRDYDMQRKNQQECHHHLQRTNLQKAVTHDISASKKSSTVNDGSQITGGSNPSPACKKLKNMLHQRMMLKNLNEAIMDMPKAAPMPSPSHGSAMFPPRSEREASAFGLTNAQGSSVGGATSAENPMISGFLRAPLSSMRPLEHSDSLQGIQRLPVAPNRAAESAPASVIQPAAAMRTLLVAPPMSSAPASLIQPAFSNSCPVQTTTSTMRTLLVAPPRSSAPASVIHPAASNSCSVQTTASTMRSLLVAPPRSAAPASVIQPAASNSCPVQTTASTMRSLLVAPPRSAAPASVIHPAASNSCSVQTTASTMRSLLVAPSRSAAPASVIQPASSNSCPVQTAASAMRSLLVAPPRSSAPVSLIQPAASNSCSVQTTASAMRSLLVAPPRSSAPVSLIQPAASNSCPVQTTASTMRSLLVAPPRSSAPASALLPGTSNSSLLKNTTPCNDRVPVAPPASGESIARSLLHLPPPVVRSVDQLARLPVGVSKSGTSILSTVGASGRSLLRPETPASRAGRLSGPAPVCSAIVQSFTASNKKAAEASPVGHIVQPGTLSSNVTVAPSITRPPPAPGHEPGSLSGPSVTCNNSIVNNMPILDKILVAPSITEPGQPALLAGSPVTDTRSTDPTMPIIDRIPGTPPVRVNEQSTMPIIDKMIATPPGVLIRRLDRLVQEGAPVLPSFRENVSAMKEGTLTTDNFSTSNKSNFDNAPPIPLTALNSFTSSSVVSSIVSPAIAQQLLGGKAKKPVSMVTKQSTPVAMVTANTPTSERNVSTSNAIGISNTLGSRENVSAHIAKGTVAKTPVSSVNLSAQNGAKNNARLPGSQLVPPSGQPPASFSSAMPLLLPFPGQPTTLKLLPNTKIVFQKPDGTPVNYKVIHQVASGKHAAVMLPKPSPSIIRVLATQPGKPLPRVAQAACSQQSQPAGPVQSRDMTQGKTIQSHEDSVQFTTGEGSSSYSSQSRPEGFTVQAVESTLAAVYGNSPPSAKMSSLTRKLEEKLEKYRSKSERREWLEKVRGTQDYQMLRARFSALFLWPALLSSVVPEQDQAGPGDNGKSQSDSRKRKQSEQSEGEDDSALTDLSIRGVAPPEALEQGYKPYAKRFRSAKYACVRSQRYRRQLLNQKLRRKNKTKASAEGGSEKKPPAKKRPQAPPVERTRISSRLAGRLPQLDPS